MGPSYGTVYGWAHMVDSDRGPRVSRLFYLLPLSAILAGVVWIVLGSGEKAGESRPAGTVEDILSHCAQLRGSMRSQVAWVRESSGEDREARYRAILWEQASTFDVPRELFDAHITSGLLGMNLTGIDRWASKQGNESPMH